MALWYTRSTDGAFLLHVRVKPNKQQTGLQEITSDALVISLHAPPSEGLANRALIRFLADFFDLPTTRIEILRGEKSRIKTIKLPGEPRITETLATLAVRRKKS